MKTVWLKLDANFFKEPHRVHSLENCVRKYQSMKISNVLFETAEEIEPIAKVARHVKTLRLKSVRFDSVTEFIFLLQKFPNLENLELSGSCIADYEYDDLPENSLPSFKLSTLNFEYYGWDSAYYDDNIVRSFYKLGVQIEDIRFEDRNYGFNSRYTTLTDFIVKQRSLKQLSVKFRSGVRPGEVFKALIDGNLAGLEKLSVDVKNIENEAQFSNLLKFLRNQAETLRELELQIEENAFPLISLNLLSLIQKSMKLEKIYLFCVTKQRNLNIELKCDIDVLLPNRHLKLLVLKNISIMSPDKLFRAFPLLEGLHLYMNDICSQNFRASTILAASTHLKSLKCLQIPKLPVIPGDGSRMRIPSLESVHINYFEKNVVDYHAKFDEFLRFNQTIEQLIFDHVAVINNVFCETIMKLLIRNNLTNLKKVIIKKIVYGSRIFEGELTSESEFMRNHLNKVSEACPNLREIEINDCTESRSFQHKNIKIKLVSSSSTMSILEMGTKRRAVTKLKRVQLYSWLKQCECSRRSYRPVCQFHNDLNNEDICH